jgi:predicted oxidoreductase (fatty acid repression mutant protein)
MKNHELFTIFDSLQKRLGQLNALRGARLAFALAKNIKLIEDEINIIRKTVEPTPEYFAYDSERVELCERLCRRDESGNLQKRAVGDTFEFDIDTDSKEWKKAMASLKAKHADAIRLRDEQIARYNELLDMECNVAFTKVRLSNLTDDINVDLMRAIQFFVTED